MEILTATRKIGVDSLEVLALEERLALAEAGDNQAAAEQIKQIFQERRERLQEPQKFEFTLAPADLVNQMHALEMAQGLGIGNGKPKEFSAYILAQVVFLVQIQDWSGFESGGQPLPCTDDNKKLVFGQASLVVQAAMEKLAAQEEAERKNLPTSLAG
jgi:exopolyphosphatase/pppGpp-phosphohydrolase